MRSTSRTIRRVQPLGTSESEKFIADLPPSTTTQVFADCTEATYRVRCKPTLQNRGLSTRISQPKTVSVSRRASGRAGRQADTSRSTRSRLFYTRGINGSSSPSAGRESAECFVNSWSSAERRAEGANRVPIRSSCSTKWGTLLHRESCSSTMSVLRRVVALPCSNKKRK